MRLDDLTSTLYLGASSWLQFQEPLAFHETTEFSWDSIIPHQNLVYTPCFGGFQCARLQVPMDWQGGSVEAAAGQTVELAIVKVEATVPVTDPTYGGAIVTNPGGPGGSGVKQVLIDGFDFRTVLSAGPNADNKTARNFDIIGFDPRGVNNTRPTVVCSSDAVEEAISWVEERTLGLMGISDTSFDNLWAWKQAVSAGCSRRVAEQGIGKHMATTTVARDIIEIFERHGQWREEEAKRRLSDPCLQHLSSDEQNEILKRTAYKPNEEKVQYWGFSYGTILGATLSALFPHRIHRAVLDGVSDAFDYMAGGWSTNLADTDGVFAKIAEYCDAGGPKNCPIYVEGGLTAIAANVQKIMSDFRHDPIALPETETEGPMIVTYNDLMFNFKVMVYAPIRYLPETAQILKDVSQRNGTSLGRWKRDSRPEIFGKTLKANCKNEGPFSPSCFPEGPAGGADPAIMCSDAYPGRINQTKESFREYADEIRSQSSLLGEYWASLQMQCTAWHAQPHWKYEGDFTAEPANPILWVGNSLDPVTPLRNAFKMAKGYQGSGVIHQNSEGHCMYASPSLCTAKKVRHYFQTGELPGQVGGLEGWDGRGAYCEPDRLPFDGYGPGAEIKVPEGETDVALWEALVRANLS